MKILLTVVIAIGMLEMIAGSVLAQSGNELFSQALSKERTEGNMAEAIKLYQTIVARYAADHRLTAKALLQIGLCYQKLGNAEEARKAFDRVLRDYKDQKEPVAQASARLVQLDRSRLVVEVAATVLEPTGRYVTGLERKNFAIFEDKVPQDIVYFSSEDVPLSVGIILDVSGSMKDKIKTAVQAAMVFTIGGNRYDEYYLVEFADRPADVADFTDDISRIQARLMLSGAKGQTALYDAVFMGLNKLSEGNNARRALLLITDGQDNRSRHTYSNVEQFMKEKDVQLYAIGLSDEAEQGREPLRKLAELSGGNAFFPPSVSEVENICRLIARNLRNQYVMGYHPTNTANDGKWRQIKVTTGAPNIKLTVRARPGYYASTWEEPSHAKD